ncbi:MAG: AAA family ATPase [Candidatus Rokubacteria bacterium]|nr:AAA family ATPase [Candidatus Rokubacteria bacterium]
MSCPQCAAPNPPTARFCSHCGSPLVVACAGCGHGNAPGSRFCNSCGEALTPALTGPTRTPDGYTPPHLAARILTSRGALEGERKHVTILLADLKGSMELLAGRDPEEARQLLDPVLDRMMEAVHHYEGTVNQVMGDGIMALFGAPLAHEDHAVRACFAALRMQDRVGRYGDEVQRSHGVPVQIRVGLNSGDVVVRSIGSDLHMDYTAVGQTTHLAARMEQMAKPGSTLLTSATLRLSEGYVRVRALGPVPIKGLGEPVEVWELLGAAAARTRLQASAARGLTRFVGRDPELEQLRAALERTRAGRGQVVAIVGEPGVGKSRLVWELVHSHRTDGWIVLESSSVSYGKATTFLPVIDLMKAYFSLEDRDDARRVREKLTGKVLTLDEALRPALPALQSLLDVSVEDAASPRLPAEQQRARIVDAVRRLLLRESQEQPLLLVVEDLHWIDADTQALLESLVESVPSRRVLLLVNYRPEYRHGWGGKTYYAQIRLDPLPPDTAETLLEALLGDDAGLPPLKSVLIERAQGNPFFLEESVRVLVETGVLAGERGAHRLAQAPSVVQVPATVQAILAARIDRLPPGDKGLLQAASVIGKDVPLPLLQAIAGLAEEDLGRGLEQLQSAEFLYEARLFPEVEYTFKHALTHEVAYASLLHERRRVLHRQTLEAIERLHAGRLAEHHDRLVHHAFRAELWTKALAYLRDTGEVASPDQIQEVMGAGPESPGQLWWTGEYERAIRAAERDLAVAASFGNFGMQVVSGCRLAQAHHAIGDYRRAIELFRQIVGWLHSDLVREPFGMVAYPSVWARSWLCWCLAERGEFAEAIAVGEEAVEIANAGDHAYSRGQAAFGLGMLYVIQARPDLGIPILEQGLVVVRVANIPFLVPFLTGPLGAAYALDGRADRAVTLLEQTVEQAVSIRLVANHALRLVWLGQAQLLGGRHDAALELARRALRIAEERKERGQQAYAHRLLADILARDESAGLEAAQAEYQRALALAEELEMRPLLAECREGTARLRGRLIR